MDLGLLGAMLGAAKEGYDEQDYLSRKQRDDDADQQRKQQEFKTQQDGADQLKQYRTQELAMQKLLLDEKTRASTANQHTRDILGGFLQGQNTGDWQPFVTAYNSTAGGIHGHQVADLAPNANGSFTATMDNGGTMDFDSADKLLNAAFLMSSPDVYRDSLERRLKAGDEGIEARAKNPKNFQQPIIDSQGNMRLLDYGTGVTTPATDDDGSPISATLAGKRPVMGSGSKQPQGRAAGRPNLPTPETLYLGAVRRGANADKATQIVRGMYPNWMQGGAGTSAAPAATAPNFSDVRSSLAGPAGITTASPPAAQTSWPNVHQPMNMLNPGQPVTQPPNGRQVVRTGVDPTTGQRVSQYNDGSIEYAQ